MLFLLQLTSPLAPAATGWEDDTDSSNGGADQPNWGMEPTEETAQAVFSEKKDLETN